jgi:NADH:ubiquinone oxidoreductase subunit 5 (subunit L)/multisubunit Na+/H+ antiporter MnhA subunit
MQAEAEAIASRRPRRVGERLAMGFLFALMAIGSLALWLGIPIGGLWALSKLTDTKANHFLAALVAIPAAMVLFAVGLAWLNRLYLRIREASQPPEDDRPWTIRGPLDYLVRWSLLLAGIAFILWFFVLAENPCSCSGC